MKILSMLFPRKQAFGIATSTTTSSIWSLPPELGIPEPPALLVEFDRLWLAYCRAVDDAIAVIRFTGVIDHRLSPINDEGIGQHPYAAAGLKFYSFNEIFGSQETRYWSTLKAKHWVVTFKDSTLDVVARAGEVVAHSIAAPTPLDALLSVVSRDEA